MTWPRLLVSVAISPIVFHILFLSASHTLALTPRRTRADGMHHEQPQLIADTILDLVNEVRAAS